MTNDIRHGQHQDTGADSDGRGEVAGQDLPVVSTEPTLNQIKRAARRLYNGGWYDQRQIIVCDLPNLVRHQDRQMNCHGTWIDASVFVPDPDALNEEP